MNEGIMCCAGRKSSSKYVHFEAGFATGEGINASMQGMRSSKFCLHLAGDTPSSNRLFNAIVSHIVPVIVSDHIELPFESELDLLQVRTILFRKRALIPGLGCGSRSKKSHIILNLTTLQRKMVQVI